jgi:hypothetical protein
MPEFTVAAKRYGRSIHDCPERSQDEIEAERVEAALASVTRRQLEEALIIMLSAARTAEGEQGWLDRHLRPMVCREAQNHIDNIGSALIEDGIDRVVDLLGSDVVEILEESA